VTHLNAYSCQAEKLSDSELPFRQVTWAQGLSKVNKGEATWEYARNGAIKGIRFTEKQRVRKASPCTLTKRVMQAVSGEGLSGIHEIRDGHESEEQALRAKFDVWGLVGDTKAVCVRPRMTQEEIRKAQKLLGIAA
jgi:hypothetical protein